MNRDNEIEIPEAWMCMIKQHNSLMISTTVSCYNNADRNPLITKGKSKDWNAPITTMFRPAVSNQNVAIHIQVTTWPIIRDHYYKPQWTSTSFITCNILLTVMVNVFFFQRYNEYIQWASTWYVYCSWQRRYYKGLYSVEKCHIVMLGFLWAMEILESRSTTLFKILV